jgi:hypothetical protein
MSSPPRQQPPGAPRLPAPLWHVTALIAASAAVVMLSLHRNAQLITAGLLAVGTAIAAEAAASLRAPRPVL